jgi:hypothetical protein
MRDEVARLAAAKAIELAKSVERQAGPKGERGEKGNQGDKGDQGLPGRNGTDGRDGVAGPKGDMGEQGQIGPQGPVGPQGVKGDKGDKGDAGPAGSDGLPGIMGERGFTGPMGPMPKHEKKGLMIRFESEPGVWGKWITMPTGGGGGGRDDKLTDRQAELVALAEFYKTRTSNANKFIKSNGTDIIWDVLDGSDIDLASPPAIGGTTPAAGTFTTLIATTSVTSPIVGAASGSSTTGLDLSVNSKAQARLVEVGDGTRPLIINGGSAGGAQITGITANAILGISAGGGNPVNFYTNGRVTTQQFAVSHTASAVNYVQVTGAATGGATRISAQGSDANIPIDIASKGTGLVTLTQNGVARLSINGNDTLLGLNGSGVASFQATPSAGAVNFFQVRQAATGSAPTLFSVGSDTNIDLALTPKGTGLVRFGTYTAGALSIAGYIEIKDAGGTTRRLAVVA